MSVIVFGLIAAAVAGASTAIAFVAHRRRAPAPPPVLPDEPSAMATLRAQPGDVVQHGDLTRWPRHGLLIRDGDELVCAILLSRERGRDEATVVMAPPARHLLWLEAADLVLPPRPPARLEIEGYLLDRRMTFPASVEVIGEAGAEAGDEAAAPATFALYEGSVGDAAVVLAGLRVRAWYGRRLDEGEYDNLGRAQGD